MQDECCRLFGVSLNWWGSLLESSFLFQPIDGSPPVDGRNVIGKNHVSNSDFQLFFNFRCIGFCSADIELFSEPERVMFIIL